MSVFTWATVSAVGPLRVTLDGDVVALPFVPDSLVDPASLSINDRVRCELSERRVVIVGRAGGVIPPGMVTMSAAPAAPAGWLLCRGQSLMRASFPALFAAIGTTYGAANGASFSLPDMQGRVPVGQSAGESEFNVLGETGGAKTHTLTIAEMPSHQHTQTLGGSITTTNQVAGGPVVGFSNTSLVSATGGGGAHNNLQPYIALNYIIKI